MKNFKITPRKIGIVEVVASGVAFGFLGVFGKAAYARGLSAGEFLSFRFLMATVFMFLLLILWQPGLLKIKPLLATKAMLLGILGYAVFSSCYFRALEGLSASLTVLLLYLYPVLVSLGALYLFKEKFSPLGWIALPLSCLGMALLVWGDIQVQSTAALFYGVGSAIVYSAYILASRKWLADVPPLTSVFYIQLGTAIALNILSFKSFARSQEVFFTAWPILLGVAILSTVIAMLLFLSGLKKLSSAETSILSTTEPITAIFAASILLHEHLSPPQILGSLLVLSSLVLTALPPPGKSLAQ